MGWEAGRCSKTPAFLFFGEGMRTFPSCRAGPCKPCYLQTNTFPGQREGREVGFPKGQAVHVGVPGGGPASTPAPGGWPLAAGGRGSRPTWNKRVNPAPAARGEEALPPLTLASCADLPPPLIPGERAPAGLRGRLHLWGDLLAGVCGQ